MKLCPNDPTIRAFADYLPAEAKYQKETMEPEDDGGEESYYDEEDDEEEEEAAANED